ncbi:MAG: polyprenyl diphosphate synthase [Acidobacteriota bacterium]
MTIIPVYSSPDASPNDVETLRRQLDPARMPRHVAVIMDGNGRWARQRGRLRVDGHRAGVDAVRNTVETAARLGLDALTLYAFSIENWKRPRHEIWTLMGLLREYLRRELPRLREHGIRLRRLGRREGLDADVLQAVDRAVDATADGGGMHLNIALNYSGRCEIVDACRSLVAEQMAGAADGAALEIDEARFGAHLYSADQPELDLLIRTSGEMRVSNFLLWQLAYAEIVFTPVLWPDFRGAHLVHALIEYQQRERRYGGVGRAGADDERVYARSG